VRLPARRRHLVTASIEADGKSHGRLCEALLVIDRAT